MSAHDICNTQSPPHFVNTSTENDCLSHWITKTDAEDFHTRVTNSHSVEMVGVKGSLVHQTMRQSYFILWCSLLQACSAKLPCDSSPAIFPVMVEKGLTSSPTNQPSPPLFCFRMFSIFSSIGGSCSSWYFAFAAACRDTTRAKNKRS